MATTSLWPPVSARTSPPWENKPRPTTTSPPTLLSSFSLQHSVQLIQCRSGAFFSLYQRSYSWCSNKDRGTSSLLAVVDEEPVATEEINAEESLNQEDDGVLKGNGVKKQPRPCELYVCNLPRSCDISELADMFKPFGTVLSVEVSKDPETGVSRGCGYVTMDSINSARNAIISLDGSHVGGREMRVRYSAEMGCPSERRNPDGLNSAPIRTMIYESPHKLYVGNLAWSARPEDLKKRFSEFGTVISVRILYDRKEGKRRAYGFISFDSAKERDAALSLNGTDFRGRILAVRKGLVR